MFLQVSNHCWGLTSTSKALCWTFVLANLCTATMNFLIWPSVQPSRWTALSIHLLYLCVFVSTIFSYAITCVVCDLPYPFVETIAFGLVLWGLYVCVFACMHVCVYAHIQFLVKHKYSNSCITNVRQCFVPFCVALLHNLIWYSHYVCVTSLFFDCLPLAYMVVW